MGNIEVLPVTPKTIGLTQKLPSAGYVSSAEEELAVGKTFRHKDGALIGHMPILAGAAPAKKRESSAPENHNIAKLLAHESIALEVMMSAYQRGKACLHLFAIAQTGDLSFLSISCSVALFALWVFSACQECPLPHAHGSALFHYDPFNQKKSLFSGNPPCGQTRKALLMVFLCKGYSGLLNFRGLDFFYLTLDEVGVNVCVAYDGQDHFDDGAWALGKAGLHPK